MKILLIAAPLYVAFLGVYFTACVMIGRYLVMAIPDKPSWLLFCGFVAGLTYVLVNYVLVNRVLDRLMRRVLLRWKIEHE